MKLGNRIIYNQDGDIIYMTGDMEGEGIERKEISSLDYIELDYGSIDYSKYRIVGVDVEKRIPIIEVIDREKTPEEIIEELENQLLLLEDERVGGIL